ncbi:MAG: hypothetical protein ACKO2L_12930 [Planctomycetaceae bacterium]
MDAFLQLVTSILQLLQAILQVLLSLINVAVPWLPLLAWIGFWGLAVNWTKAFPILRRGGYFGVLLLMFAAVLVWGSVAPPEGGLHFLLGLSVSNYTGKFLYVTMLTCIALLCGSAQLNGAFGRLAEFPEEPAAEDYGHGHDHGHDNGHGHDHDHGHGNDHGHGHGGDHGHASHAHAHAH